jgi:hypothetical protein
VVDALIKAAEEMSERRQPGGVSSAAAAAAAAAAATEGGAGTDDVLVADGIVEVPAFPVECPVVRMDNSALAAEARPGFVPSFYPAFPEAFTYRFTSMDVVTRGDRGVAKRLHTQLSREVRCSCCSCCSLLLLLLLLLLLFLVCYSA